MACVGLATVHFPAPPVALAPPPWLLFAPLVAEAPCCPPDRAELDADADEVAVPCDVCEVDWDVWVCCWATVNPPTNAAAMRGRVSPFMRSLHALGRRLKGNRSKKLPTASNERPWDKLEELRGSVAAKGESNAAPCPLFILTYTSGECRREVIPCDQGRKRCPQGLCTVSYRTSP